MKTLFGKLADNSQTILSTILNLGGTALIIAGIIMLPINIAIRLIILGVFALVLWKAINN